MTTISAVLPDSFAHRVGLRAGDELLAINGRRVRDVIDVRYYAAEPLVRLSIGRDGGEHVIEGERRYDEELGLEFREPLFDGVRRCNNRCEFCFVAQMPPGLRRSLYVRDDDYRLSFLSGSYITLTNLTRADWERINEQHLSPLYVSVHVTEPGLRRALLANPDAPDVLTQLRRLAGMGIEVHTQIVVRPGWNDGLPLARSISDLRGLYPAVRSVSVVPLGLTKYHRSDCRLPTDREMDAVVGQVSWWQARFRREMGVAFAYLSDEWYLRLGRDVPPMGHYDGLDLTENGVGLVCCFLNREVEPLAGLVAGLRSPSLVTGALFAPVLRAAVAGLGGRSAAEVIAVPNRFFGDSVTVAGLLTAGDVIARLRDRDADGAVLLPPAMFAGPDGRSLDGLGPADVEEALGRAVVVRSGGPVEQGQGGAGVEGLEGWKQLI